MPADLRYRLAELILAESARAGLGQGSRLPTERKLAADMGATRTSIRHALAVLQAQGHISREVGRGTFLRHDPAQRALAGSGGPGLAVATPDGVAGLAGGGLFPGADGARAGGPAAGPGARRGAAGGPGLGARGAGQAGEVPASFAPADVMTIRRLLEPLAMPLVVAWATASDFREMDRCLAGGDRADGYDEFENWDLALHRTIMAASHSPLLGQLYAVIETARHGHSWGDLKRRSASRERRERYQADHSELVTALRARDSDRATEAMRTHLSRVNNDLFGETA
ncbi:MAG: GntR family transcriptional regulator, uxu operon transcriptional repressor [Streptosporangiaceae bacterium]|jgi:DNA-binding FadR family transcriptional regulator|nr:GntR family transcriptional regulator, uxu operon transcriptional repressor [Streptosporangiaceae bacterium]